MFFLCNLIDENRLCMKPSDTKGEDYDPSLVCHFTLAGHGGNPYKP